MTTLASTISEGFRARRSIRALTNETKISDARIEELVSDVTLHTPSPFNVQSGRLVVLLKEEHQRLWDIAYEAASASVPQGVFEKMYKPRIAAFRAGYGTVSSSFFVLEFKTETWANLLTIHKVLFYEDPVPFKALEEKWPMLTQKFPECMSHFDVRSTSMNINTKQGRNTRVECINLRVSVPGEAQL
jgi:predicted oxidoreductase (fatty acid repression mutant protein)